MGHVGVGWAGHAGVGWVMQGSPVETDLEKVEQCSQDVCEVCRGIGMARTLTGITITQLNMFEGSRL